MFCQQCGSANPDTGTFCTKCGASLTAGAQPASGAGPSAAPAFASAQPAAPVQEAAANPAFLPVQPAPAAKPLYAEGCVAAAWHDVKGTPGWLKKMLLLGLLNVIPILNWIVPGYALRWAREVSFGRREDMPREIFGDRAFVTGFFYTLVMAIVFTVVSVVSNVLFMIGGYRLFAVMALIVLIGSVFLGLFANVCVIRMAVCDSLGAAFSLSKCGKAYGKSLGPLFCASVVPGLIVGLIYVAISIVVAIIFLLIALGGAASFSSYSYYGSAAGMQMLMGMGVSGLLLMLVSWVLFAMLQAISTTITMRALGHWASRVAPEWAAEAQMGAYATYGNSAAPYGQTPAMQPYDMPATSPYSGPAAAPASAPAPHPSAAPVFPADPHPVSPSPVASASSAARDDSTTMLGGGAALGSQGISLSLTRSNGQRFDVASFPATVGKGSAANVCIAGNNSISRVHVRISQAGASLVVEDLGSTNKTYLNGDCLAEGELVILKDGDELRLGDEALTVHVK